MRRNNMEPKNAVIVSEGEYSGAIYKIDIEDENTVIVRTYVDMDGEVKDYNVKFKNIFEKGRKDFQNFCNAFDLFVILENEYGDYEYELDLDEALGRFCVLLIDENRLELYSGIGDGVSEKELYRKLKNVNVSETVDNVPMIIKKYFPFPYIGEDNYSDNEYLGFVMNIESFKDRNEPTDKTLRIMVKVFNGGKVRTFYYYINRIFSEGEHELQKFFDTFDTDYSTFINEPKKVLKRMNKTPLIVSLYKSSISGKIYVSSLEPFYYCNEYEKEQFKRFAASYRKYLESEQPWEDCF